MACSCCSPTSSTRPAPFAGSGARALEHGNIDARGEALLLLTELEIWTGNWPLADQYASECLELARQVDTSNGEP